MLEGVREQEGVGGCGGVEWGRGAANLQNIWLRAPASCVCVCGGGGGKKGQDA